MKMEFYPRGVCSHRYEITLENGVIEDIRIEGGCHGNLQGITRLIKGRKAEEVIGLLKGVRCGFKDTSCPDQISKALEKALAKEANA